MDGCSGTRLRMELARRLSASLNSQLLRLRLMTLRQGKRVACFPPGSSAAPGQGLAGSGPYLNPSCSRQGTNCYDGDNWFDIGGHGGGIWMSAKGPSSDKTGNVYVASGNGPFGCTNPSNSACLNGSNVVNFGESVIGLSGGTVTPVGLFYSQRSALSQRHEPRKPVPGAESLRSGFRDARRHSVRI